MRNESPGNDPRAMWQHQPTEASAMTSESIRQKARELHVMTRRRLLQNMALPVVIVGFYSFGISRFHDPVLRILFAIAIAWSLAGAYFLNRGMWSAMLPGDVGMATGLASYRREVERRRSLHRRFLVWAFGPAAFAVAALIMLILNLGAGRGFSTRGSLLKMTPFLTLLVGWLVGVFVIRMREQRELRREIERLNDIERANSGD